MSKKIAYGGILLSLNAILLMLINVIPINTVFLLGLASLPISIIIMEWGLSTGIIFYISSAILGFIVINSKVQWLIYIFTFGIYGLVKYIIESDRHIIVEYLLKLIFANTSVLILYFIIKQFVYIPINVITICAFELVFILYDYIYSEFIDYYHIKIKKIIKINKGTHHND
ncbi:MULTISPECIES: hypothetical protein [unclassified Romboutsia]|uniref:hypothetical protein n=1 Tax=unclassified Romboutsia TaxID=2626894 RepID=UPI0008212B60|nr:MULTISPECIES: hypothetical protein [unclassified Romboutsia]SCI32731.1 Uncharacterised protein [uncultured Clostridium sp.]